MNICDGALVPGSSLLDSNFAYCEELWQILQHFPHEKRYWIYGRWKNVHSPRYWDLTIQRAKVLGMTRYAMKFVAIFIFCGLCVKVTFLCAVDLL